MMDVILSQDIEKLGKVGDVVKVKDGYARNFLFPHKKACVATEANLKLIAQQKKKRQEQYEKQKTEAQNFADKLSKVSCTVNVEVNDLDKLYGAVTEAEILKALELESITVEKKQLVIEKPLDQLGIFEVGVKLHPEVIAKVRVWVTKK